MNVIDKEHTDNTRERIAAVGMWDGVHSGHRFLINFVKAEAERRGLTPAVVTFDTHPLTIVRPHSAPKLLNSYDERLDRLDRAGIIDCVMLTFDDEMRHTRAHDFLKMLRNDYAVKTLVVGFNNRFGHDRVDGIEQYREIASEIGMEIIEAPEFSGNYGKVSSSIIRRLLEKGDVKAAAERLGYSYSIRGKVVSGAHVGRTIGFPTANILPEDEQVLIPAPGVYAVTVTTPDGIDRMGMVNIGTRPTVAGSNATELTIEVNILDFSGFLYEEELTLHFIERLRGEKKFSSLKKLASALEADAAKVRKLLTQPH